MIFISVNICQGKCQPKKCFWIFWTLSVKISLSAPMFSAQQWSYSKLPTLIPGNFHASCPLLNPLQPLTQANRLRFPAALPRNNVSWKFPSSNASTANLSTVPFLHSKQSNHNSLYCSNGLKDRGKTSKHVLSVTFTAFEQGWASFAHQRSIRMWEEVFDWYRALAILNHFLRQMTKHFHKSAKV